MIKIDQNLIKQVSDKAKVNQRKRMNYNFHYSDEDTLHRMVNAIEPGSYVQPHKHHNPDKREAFIILHGKVLVVEFDEQGNIIDHIILTKETNFGVEIPPDTYHTIISLEPYSVLYEVKDGPYDPKSDKTFAPWAPEEGNQDSDNYLKNILKQINL